MPLNYYYISWEKRDSKDSTSRQTTERRVKHEINLMKNPKYNVQLRFGHQCQDCPTNVLCVNYQRHGESRYRGGVYIFARTHSVLDIKTTSAAQQRYVRYVE